MSQPAPMRSPPEPSMTVKAPIQVPSPISGSPMIHAWGLYGLGGRSPTVFPDEVGHALLDRDGRRPAEDLLGTLDVRGTAGHQHVALVELWLDVDADGADEDLGER